MSKMEARLKFSLLSVRVKVLIRSLTGRSEMLQSVVHNGKSLESDLSAKLRTVQTEECHWITDRPRNVILRRRSHERQLQQNY